MDQQENINLLKYDLGTYKKFTKKSELDKAFHTLEGLLKGISIDNTINEKEIKELLSWCDYYGDLLKNDSVNDVIKVIKNSIEDGILEESEKKDILWLCNNFKTGNIYYDCITSNIQKLQGILYGILADGIIKDSEIFELKKWLSNNDQLTGTYPYDEIYSIITAVLADGHIDENERNILKVFFSDFIDTNISKNINLEELENLRNEICIDGICVMCPEIALVDSVFCFTGTSSRASRKEIVNKISTIGGIYHDTVTSKTDYLIIGNEGNKCWSFSCYGRKVEQAVNMRKKGKKILIVHENDFWDAIEDTN